MCARMVGILLLAAFLCVCLSATEGVAANFNNIVVVSIDALHPDALTSTNAPLTCALLKKGHLTRNGQSTHPPKTLVSHAAMVTGIGPEQGGRKSNTWESGEPPVQGQTIFHFAKAQGYRTAFFYSKSKLGFLQTSATDACQLSRDDATGMAARFLEDNEPNFVFIHISGLDFVGPEYGWLSPEYLEELSYIDQYLEEVYEVLTRAGDYLLIITSDHGGYEKSHGGIHPEEARLPFGAVSDVCEFPEVQDAPYHVTQLPDFIERAMTCEARASK